MNTSDQHTATFDDDDDDNDKENMLWYANPLQITNSMKNEEIRFFDDRNTLAHNVTDRNDIPSINSNAT